MRVKNLFLLVIPLVLAACGFHLRGASPLPDWLSPVHVENDSRYGEAVETLRLALRAAGAGLVADPERASAVIVVDGEQRERRILSVDSEGRPREYELIYRISYRVRDAKGGMLLPAGSVTRSREYTFDEADVLGKSTEREELWRELRRRAAEAVVDRLRYGRPLRR